MKFAYMIMAHDEPCILNRLLQMLDYPENDIFLHIDSKSTSINFKSLHTHNARLELVRSNSVTWGDRV